MIDDSYLRNLRIPTAEDPLRVLTSACLIGTLCGVDGSSNGSYPSVLRLIGMKTIRLTPFCPEDAAFGTPRETPDIHGGDGFDVLDGKAKFMSESGLDWSEGIIRASEKMLAIAQQADVELAIMMDISAACGSQVIYEGARNRHDKAYQIGMGVCAAQLTRHGFKVISQRDFAALEILYQKLDPDHVIDPNAKDQDQTDWYRSYFHRP